MTLDGYKQIATHIEQRVRAKGLDGVSFSGPQTRKWARRSYDPLPIVHFAGSVYAIAAAVDEWTDRNFGQPREYHARREVCEVAQVAPVPQLALLK